MNLVECDVQEEDHSKYKSTTLQINVLLKHDIHSLETDHCNAVPLHLLLQIIHFVYYVVLFSSMYVQIS